MDVDIPDFQAHWYLKNTGGSMGAAVEQPLSSCRLELHNTYILQLIDKCQNLE
jgi:hypothetical protein